MVFGFGESHDAYRQVYGNSDGNTASLGHEVIAGAASFAGFKVFEDHQRAEGKPVSHALAKEMLAGFVGAEVDKLAETKGEDMWDRERAKRAARENAEHMYDKHYLEHHNADEYNPRDYRAPEVFQQEYDTRYG